MDGLTASSGASKHAPTVVNRLADTRLLCSAAHLLAGAGEEEHRIPRLLQARQGGAVRVEGREDDLPLARLLEHHLRACGAVAGQQTLQMM